MRGIRLVVLASSLLSVGRAFSADYDVVVYGGTSAGIVAAMKADRLGHRVALVCPETRVGGMTTNGLGWTDSGNKNVIGGMARDFYREVKQHYSSPSAWTYDQQDKFSRYRPDDDTMWVFEPHLALAIYELWLNDSGVEVTRDAWLDCEQGVSLRDNRIVAIKTLDGGHYAGRVFIDATYEGDLMAAAGVSYTVGREANSQYDETLNGVQTKNATSHQFDRPIDPFHTPGNPASGLLPRISSEPPGEHGAADNRVQAYCYRVCLTDVAANRVAFPQPAGYDPAEYELLLRYLVAGSRHTFGKFDPMPNGKTDTNNSGAFSTDNIGKNYDYPEASYERRQEILDEHIRYQQGYFYFLANDSRVPNDVRTRMARWGLAKDEFAETGHWPAQIYVREARRMVSDFVITENHVRRTLPSERPIGRGSYNMDSHNVQRYATQKDDGTWVVLNEGDVQKSPGGDYPIDYGAIVPRRGECTNLLVPVCVSASHIAYGSIRMEPVFMILGESAAEAAHLAIEGDVAVQDVDYRELRERLTAAGQVLE